MQRFAPPFALRMFPFGGRVRNTTARSPDHLATFECFGTSKSTATRREPQRGHLSLLSRCVSGKSRPLVHTSVSRSSAFRYVHSRTLFIASRLPHAQRIVIPHPALQASPRVSTAMEQSENIWTDESMPKANGAAARRAFWRTGGMCPALPPFASVRRLISFKPPRLLRSDL